MEKEFLVTRNFKPRDNIIEEGEKLIKNEIRQSLGATDVDIKVVIVDSGSSFTISGVALSEKRIFSSQSEYVKKNIRGWPRDWQLMAVSVILRDLVAQLKSCLPGSKPRSNRPKTDEMK